MSSIRSGSKIPKKSLIFFAISALLVLSAVSSGNAQIIPSYYPPVVDPLFYYAGFPAPVLPFTPVSFGFTYPVYGFPPRTASVLTTTSTLLTTLLTPTTTTTSAPLIGVSTAITLASLGGGVSSTTLATLAATPVPTTVTATPTLGTTTALLLGGGVSTSTLLLLGI